MTSDRYDLTRHQTLQTPGRRRNEWKSGSDPTAADDESKAYEVGSRWLNATTGEVFTCIDARAGAAVWRGGSHGELVELGDDDHHQYGLVWSQADPPAAPPRNEAIWIDTDASSSGSAPAVHLHDADEVAYDDTAGDFPLTPSTQFLRPNGDVVAPASWSNSGTQAAWQQIDEAVDNTADYADHGTAGARYSLTDFTGLATDHIRRIRIVAHAATFAPSDPGNMGLYDPSSASATGILLQWGQNENATKTSAWLTTCWWDGAPWTIARLALLQLRPWHNGPNGGLRVYSASVEVEYDAGITVQVAIGLIEDEIDAHALVPHGGGGGGGGAPLPAARARRTSGNLTLNSTTWANVDTGLDLVVPAQAGDVLHITLTGLLASAAVAVGLDVVTVVSGSPVNSVSASGVSDYGFLYGAVSQEDAITGSIQYVVQSGDISGGNVTLRLRYKTSGATNRTFYAGSGGNPQFNWSVVNLRVGGPGSELAYQEFTADVAVASTTEATPTNVVSAPAITLDGATSVIVEVYSNEASGATAGLICTCNLWDGSTDLGRIAHMTVDRATDWRMPLLLRRRLTPAAGSHTYHWKAWKNGASTFTIDAGVGGAGVRMPGYIRVTVA